MILRFCSNCGKNNQYGCIDGNMRYHCINCNTIHYQNPKPTATLVCPKKNDLLFVKRACEPGRGLWGLPGGFIELNETPNDAAIRELFEETRLVGSVKSFIGHCNHFGSIFGDILLLGLEMKIDNFSTLEANDDADDAKLFNIDSLPRLAFECHHKIINMYKHGRK